MYCKQCQHELPDDSLFCELCGARQDTPALIEGHQDEPPTSDPPSDHIGDGSAQQKPKPELQLDDPREPEVEPAAQSESDTDESGLDFDNDLRIDEGENLSPVITPMNWSAKSVPTIAPPSFPQEPRLERGVIIGIAIISAAVAVILLLITVWTVLHLLQSY